LLAGTNAPTLNANGLIEFDWAWAIVPPPKTAPIASAAPAAIFAD